MEVYLNRIDGLDDAIVALYMSKRNMNREKEHELRELVAANQVLRRSRKIPAGAFGTVLDPELERLLDKLKMYAVEHITLGRFLDFSFTVYGLHRGAQDDFDSHAKRLGNRIVRASTRLADFGPGEVSEWYEDKIVSTDAALAFLGIEIPEEIEYQGHTYVRTVNGYARKGMENNRDVKRGLYMLSIPSSFIFKCDLTEFAHIYKMRNQWSTAAPELKIAVESMADQLEEYTSGFVTRDLLLKIEN